MTTLAAVTLSEAGLSGLQIKVDALNKRAKRHNMEVITVRVVDSYEEKEVQRYNVEINGRAPRIEGWVISARIELNNPIGKIVHVVPGPYKDADYAEYRSHSGRCDHCQSNRKRNDVFVLTDSNGKRKVVGRNCLADFLRDEDADDFVRYAEWCEEIAGYTDSDLSDCAYDDGFGSGRGIPSIPIERFLRITSLVIRHNGWVSRSNAKDLDGVSSTADNVAFYLYGRGRYADKYREEIGEPTAYDIALATNAIKWTVKVEPETSEYLYTIGKIAKAGFVAAGTDGYAASIIRAYQRDCERIEERIKRESSAPEKDYIGSIKERLRDLKVKVLRVRYFEGNYGVITIVSMETDLPNGSVAPLTWFASGSKDFEEGSEYSITATIKDHKEDPKYGKQTIVTRAKMVEYDD